MGVEVDAAVPVQNRHDAAALMPATMEAPALIPLKPVVEKKADAQAVGYNTSRLGLRLFSDGAAALSAGILVAPIITAIDIAVISNASGRQALMPSLRASLTALVSRPHHFLLSRPFALILALYTGTYLTANTLDTARATYSNRPASSTTSGAAKFVATSTANLSLCLYKDSQFTRMFGTVTARPLPGPSYALFVLRDCATIFASFNLPAIIAPRLPMSEAASRWASPTSVAQFVAPAAIQLLSTPLHLLGLDLYNRQEGRVSLADRLTKVRRDWLMTSLARMARIIPAFGVGGVVNTNVRSRLMKRLE